MTNRIATFAVTLVLLLPLAASKPSAEPLLDRQVAPADVMNQIGGIVRREFFDRRALGAFVKAESRSRSWPPVAALPRRAAAG